MSHLSLKAIFTQLSTGPERLQFCCDDEQSQQKVIKLTNMDVDTQSPHPQKAFL